MCLYIQARPIKPISLQTSDKPNTNEGIFYLRLALLEPEEEVLTEETTDSGDVQEVRPLRELNLIEIYIFNITFIVRQYYGNLVYILKS